MQVQFNIYRFQIRYSSPVIIQNYTFFLKASPNFQPNIKEKKSLNHTYHSLDILRLDTNAMLQTSA